MELTSEEVSLLKKFKRCVDSRSIEKMDKPLYHFFMYDCSFIAHYNIHGFRDEYRGTEFLRWFKTFSDPNWMFFHSNGKKENLKRACVDYAQQQKDCVIADFERQERNRKIRLLHALSAELGMQEALNINSSKNDVTDLPLQEDESGQFVLFG
jgi:23S rRNA G2445 N2-methylase RlmL